MKIILRQHQAINTGSTTTPNNPWRTSENKGTWDLVSKHNAWYKNNDGSYVRYGSYSASVRRIFDLRKSAMRTYWANHAYHAARGNGSTQFDGIFADNWLRSNGPDSTGWRKGANEAARLLKSRWSGDKILVGNGLYSPDYNARDFGMIEDYSSNMRMGFLFYQMILQKPISLP
ncbi:MAG: putative glycoside hydrolase family 15 protein [Bacillus subtilis]|nr:putative glycoside hydrolase family 15 protein [Bacillus subtilis]